jgi:hypothetical protein
VYTNNSHFGSPQVQPNGIRHPSFSTRKYTQVLSFHILAHSFAHRKTQPFYFQAIPHSLHKTPGVGERCHLLEGMNDKQRQDGAVAACRLCGAEWSA